MEVVTSISNYDMSMCANHLAKPSGCESAAQGTPTYERISQPIFAMYIVSILYSPKMQQGSRMTWNKMASSQFSRLKILNTLFCHQGKYSHASPLRTRPRLTSVGMKHFKPILAVIPIHIENKQKHTNKQTNKQRIGALY